MRPPPSYAQVAGEARPTLQSSAGQAGRLPPHPQQQNTYTTNRSEDASKASAGQSRLSASYFPPGRIPLFGANAAPSGVFPKQPLQKRSEFGAQGQAAAPSGVFPKQPPQKRSEFGAQGQAAAPSGVFPKQPPQKRSEFGAQGQAAGGVGGGGAFAMSTSLHVKGLPQEINNEAVLMSHFSKFGTVSVKCNTAKLYATVSFKTHVSRRVSINVVTIL